MIMGEECEDVYYCPKSMKELLIEMKDTSELMVDLAFAAVVYDNREIAEEILRLEEKIENLGYHMWVAGMLSARTVDDAKELVGVMQASEAAKIISSAAGDVAKMVLLDIPIPLDFKLELQEAEETIIRVSVSEDSVLCDKSLGEVELDAETGMWVIAIRRGTTWIYNPNKDTVVKAGDVLFARGHDEGVPLFVKLATGKEYEKLKLTPSKTLEDLDMAVNLTIEMKNTSELAVGLAYFALLHNDIDIAREVEFLEGRMDEMIIELTRWVLKSAKEVDEVDQLMGLLYLASACEIISDAAEDLIKGVVKGLVSSKVVELAVRESDEIVTQILVEEGSEVDGKTLGELKLATETGMYVLAIRRKGWWIYDPSAKTKLKAGDYLIARGTRTGEEILKRMCSRKKV